MRNTLKYIFSVLLLFPVAAFCQPAELSRGLRIGFDLSSAAISAIEGEGVEAGFTADMNFKESYFAVADLGYVNRVKKGPGYEISQDALYFRAGADYNFYERDNDVIAFGLRYGLSTFRHKGDKVVVENPLWGNYTGEMSGNNLGAQWIEAVFSLKTELSGNIFLGWSLRGKVMLSSKSDENMEEWHIPGYGMSGNPSTLGVNFYIFYRIPF